MAKHRWRLDGEVALVTGASAGIGQAIAAELAGLGASVLMIARDPDQLERARKEIADDQPQVAIHAKACDAAAADGRDALCDWIEDMGLGLSILVNNVGANQTRAAIDYAENEWRALFETNVFSAFE
ncbi:MAG: tropinone reductase, partial [Lysobacterales bacterium CG17_big_fil_post_rev_8_21_14_2_50_64_11]